MYLRVCLRGENMNENLNHEGYADPVPGDALRKAEKEEKKKRGLGFRPVVYICSPFRGDTENNTIKARRYSRFAVNRGAIPFAPHLLFPQYMNDADERALALFMGLVMLDKCAEVWVFGKDFSDGMKGEIERAKFKNKKIRYFSEEAGL